MPRFTLLLSLCRPTALLLSVSASQPLLPEVAGSESPTFSIHAPTNHRLQDVPILWPTPISWMFYLLAWI